MPFVRAAILWVLVGFTFQFAALLFARARMGGRATDVFTMAVYKSRWLVVATTISGAILWPFGVWIFFAPPKRLLAHLATGPQVAVDEDSRTFCPQCGERWLRHGPDNSCPH